MRLRDSVLQALPQETSKWRVCDAIDANGDQRRLDIEHLSLMRPSSG